VKVIAKMKVVMLAVRQRKPRCCLQQLELGNGNDDSDSHICIGGNTDITGDDSDGDNSNGDNDNCGAGANNNGCDGDNDTCGGTRQRWQK